MRILTALVLGCLAGPAFADSAATQNAMGYRLVPASDARALPHNHGALGLDVNLGKKITDSGMTFDVIRVTKVRQGSAGEQAGLQPGDQIIALNGRVFPDLNTFAAFIGSLTPGSQIMVDYMPAGSGPQKARRIAVTVGRS